MGVRWAVLLCLLAFYRPAVGEWAAALPGWNYQFPRDHGAHPTFKTEWWYFTGHVKTAEGREFGYQLTFFRQGIQPPGAALDARSRFVVRDLKFAHAALSDLTGKRFRHAQKVSRGAFGEAGFSAGSVWIADWRLEMTREKFVLRGSAEGAVFELGLVLEKEPVIHGKDGVSRKAEGAGRASHYYSFTRMRTTGRVMVGDEIHEVQGESWFDHEWATNQLTDDQIGWDWFSLQMDDGTDLMLFQIRTRGGEKDRASSGTVVTPQGEQRHVEIFELTPVQWWESSETGGRYPVKWRLAIPGEGLDLEIEAAFERQELVLKPIAYWEGAVRVRGRRNSQKMRGRGYMEMVGYAGGIPGMQQKSSDP